MAWHHEGKVEGCSHREYGFAQIQMGKIRGDKDSTVDTLFEGLGDEMQVQNRVFLPLTHILKNALRFGCLMAISF
jgi:hypothetical protein